MLASLAEAPLVDPNLVYERKYDGIRVVADIDPSGRVRLWSRQGNDKTAQFPEIADALGRWARQGKRAAVLDGEIVALDARGEPARFQRLQARIHTRGGSGAPAQTAFVAFDLLRLGAEVLTARPWGERRDRLEQTLAGGTSAVIRLSDLAVGDGRALMDRARREGWEGLVVKDVRSRYRPGKRTPDWRKLKIRRQQEFVIAGWTEPRGSRRHFGALLLGVYESRGRSGERSRPFVYVVHRGRAGPRDAAARAARNTRMSLRRGSVHQRTSPLGDAVARGRGGVLGVDG
jgi:bifunctional non-homologous end joining protein LigD